MKVRSLHVENFRKFRDPIRLDGFADGLNLVCEPNETGKSTVLEAMRAALFENHKSKSAAIRSFVPHDDDVSPMVELGFEVDGARWTVRKRFMRPEVRLTAPDGRRSEGDAAEEALQALLGFSKAKTSGADEESRGALGLFWVEQGGAFDLVAPGQSARRTLEGVLESEVGAVTGGKRAPAVLARVAADLDALQTRTGASKGALKEAETALAQSKEEGRLAAADLDRFGETLDRLHAKRGELRRLEQELRDRDPIAEESALRVDLARAEQAGARKAAAEAVAEAARLRRDAADAAVAARGNARSGLADAEKAVGDAQAEVAKLAEDLAFASSEVVAADQALEAARVAEDQAQRDRDTAARAREAGESHRALKAGFTRLSDAEQSDEEVRRLEALLVGEPITAAVSAKIDALDRAVSIAQAGVDAGASLVEFSLASEAAGKVAVDGVPVTAPDAVFHVVGPTRIEIQGVGAIALRPPMGASAAGHAKLNAARQALADALRRLSVGDAVQAAARAARRSALETELAIARRSLSVACPADPALGLVEGLPALRAALVGKSRPSEDSGDAAALRRVAETADAEQRRRRTALDQAAERRNGAGTRLATVEAHQVRLGVIVRQALSDRDRGRTALAKAEQARSDAALAAEAAEFAIAAARTALDLEEAARTAAVLDPQICRTRLTGHTQHLARLAADRQELNVDIARFEEAAKAQGGAGPATRAEAAREAEASAQVDVDRLAEEAAVLRLLKTTLDAATADAARRYLAPVISRVDPYVRRLIPSASLVFGEDMRPISLTRAGRSEDAQRLSKGTQEQLAVLTRLAFAEMVAAKGRPASVILDDALVYSDDARFETMIDILTESSKRLQIIVLTCRASLFRRMEATRLGLCRS